LTRKAGVLLRNDPAQECAELSVRATDSTQEEAAAAERFDSSTAPTDHESPERSRDPSVETEKDTQSGVDQFASTDAEAPDVRQPEPTTNVAPNSPADAISDPTDRSADAPRPEHRSHDRTTSFSSLDALVSQSSSDELPRIPGYRVLEKI